MSFQVSVPMSPSQGGLYGAPIRILQLLMVAGWGCGKSDGIVKEFGMNVLYLK